MPEDILIAKALQASVRKSERLEAIVEMQQEHIEELAPTVVCGNALTKNM